MTIKFLDIMKAVIFVKLLLMIINCKIAISSFQNQLLMKDENQTILLSELGRHNFLVGIAIVGLRYENLTNCGKDLEALVQTTLRGDIWSIKVIDSFGAIPRSFIWGNYFWFGSQEFCEDLNVPYTITLSKPVHINDKSPFALRFLVVYLKFRSPLYVDLKLPFESLIHAGLCLPQSCTEDKIMSYTKEYFQTALYEQQNNFLLRDLEAVDIRTPTFDWSFLKTTSGVIFIVCLLVSILFTIIAELLKLHNHHKQTQQNSVEQSPDIRRIATFFEQKCSFVKEFLLYFSITENFKRALQDDNSKSRGSLHAIGGIRLILCVWVTVFHIYYYSLYAISNTPLIFAKLENFLYQPLIQACYFVDGFFVISAFLLVYNFLSNVDLIERIKTNNIGSNMLLFLRSILYRYMRLTPVLAITMLLSDIVFDFLNMYSPFRLSVHGGIYCKRSWWYNLLYIQNFLSMKDICCSWTWFLACEMQFYVFYMALLYIQTRLPEIVTKIIFLLITLAFVLIGWFSNYYYGFSFRIDTIHATLDQLYIKPWVRINAYNGGIALGWLFFHHCKNGSKFIGSSSVERWLFWLFCATYCAVTNFISYWRTAPVWFVASIMSVGKILLAICIGGVIGVPSWFNTVLSSQLFRISQKFCFSIYMLAPVIVFVLFGVQHEAVRFSEVGSFTDLISITLISFIASILLFILVEAPIQRITHTFLNLNNNKH